MSTKIIHPSISEKAFNCPYCEVLAIQDWYALGAKQKDKSNLIKVPDSFSYIFGSPFPTDGGIPYNTYIQNLNISKCSNCEKFSVWVHKSLVFPANREGPVPNEYLSEDIRRDFDEARSIVNNSPRGAAALLRLCIQKLCVSLGASGKSINDDIASLVEKGLNKRIQQALDVVRVIGNEAVHPGEMDIRDDHDTVFQLFELINLIAEQMLSQPDKIQKLYDNLSGAKRLAIDERDKETN
jgi:hypothetical protein